MKSDAVVAKLCRGTTNGDPRCVRRSCNASSTVSVVIVMYR